MPDWLPGKEAMRNPYYAKLQGELDQLAAACVVPAPVPLHERYRTLEDLEMTAAELIAEHTGRSEWGQP